jgi:TolA-binding protein
VGRALAASGDPAAAGEEYGAAAIRFAEQEQVAGEAWLRGAEAWRDAGDEDAAARFVSQLRERFPDSSWADQAAELFPPAPEPATDSS